MREVTRQKDIYLAPILAVNRGTNLREELEIPSFFDEERAPVQCPAWHVVTPLLSSHEPPSDSMAGACSTKGGLDPKKENALPAQMPLSLDPFLRSDHQSDTTADQNALRALAESVYCANVTLSKSLE